MGENASAAYIDATGLALRRGGRLLLSGFDADLRPGAAMILTGPNGIGKSSLLRAIAGLLPLLEGKLEVNGDIGFADQTIALDPNLPLSDALSFWATIDHGRGAARKHVNDALSAMGLAALSYIPVHMLSTGQARRAAIARLLVRNANIWLLDEPANGLDDESLDRLGTAISAHRACGGIFVAASHQPLPIEGAVICDLGLYARGEVA